MNLQIDQENIRHKLSCIILLMAMARVSVCIGRIEIIMYVLAASGYRN